MWQPRCNAWSAVTKTTHEEIIKRETPAEVVPGICFMDGGPGRIQLAVLVTCSEKMVVGKNDRVYLQKRAVKCGWAVNQKYGSVCHNTVGRMLITHLWHRVEPCYGFIYPYTFDVMVRRILFRLVKIGLSLHRRTDRNPDDILSYCTRRPGRRTGGYSRYSYPPIRFFVEDYEIK